METETPLLYMFYVCDHCGLLEARDPVAEGDEWTCADCGSHAAWEFPRSHAEDALAHSRHIIRGNRSGIFRR